MVAAQYFRPEVGATQNRLGSFVDGLIDRGHQITVVCEQPNHPSGIFQAGFGRRPLAVERAGPLTVHRTWVAASPRKSTINRLAFYATYAGAAGALAAVLPRADVVFASSPPLPGPLMVAAAARARRIPFVLDVRDLWPAAAEALGELSNVRVLRALERGERWLYRTSAAVTATTRPFCTHIDAVTGHPIAVHVPNGALDELVKQPVAPLPSPEPFTVGYAGNFGIAQGLGIVLDAAELLLERPVHFVLVGAGPEEEALRSEIRRRGLANVELRPEVPVAEIGGFLASCHALLVPLRHHPLLRDFIPSKLYDGMAVGRPVLVAAAGEPSALVRETGCGIEVAPEDGAALAAAVEVLRGDPPRAATMAAAGRKAVAGLTRSRQVERLEAVLQDAAARRAELSAA